MSLLPNTMVVIEKTSLCASQSFRWVVGRYWQAGNGIKWVLSSLTSHRFFHS